MKVKLRSVIGNIFLIIFGGIISFLLAEGILRLFKPQIFEVHPPGMYVLDPDVGYALTPGYEGYISRAEFHHSFTINQSGLRGPEIRARQPTTVRILVLGDSLTWGFGVKDDETFAYILEKKISELYPELDIQVLNAGVPGFGTADQLAILKSLGEAFEPDVVIVQFLSVNDLKENHTPARDWAIIENGMLGHNNQDGAADLNRTIPTWASLQLWLKQHSHMARLTFDTLGYLGTRFGVLDQADFLWGEDFSQEDAKLGKDYLVEIANFAKSINAKTLFLYTTGQAQVIQETYQQPRSASIIAEAARVADATWVDASEKLSLRNDKFDLYYAKDGHWTPRGHQAIAEILAQEIIRFRVIEKHTGNLSTKKNHFACLIISIKLCDPIYS